MFEKSSASAPATIANLNNGFDILGMAFPALADVVHLEQCPSEQGIWIRSIKGNVALPKVPERNTATIPLLQMHQDFEWPFGIAVDIEKHIPIASGMGGSAACAVAAVKAASVWAPSTLTVQQQLYYASLGEEIASGTSAHFDNIGPALVEGLVLITPHQASMLKSLPRPKGLTIVLWHSPIQIPTSESRKRLNQQVPLNLHIQQSSYLASSLVDLYEDNPKGWARQLQDLLIEPQRKAAIPGYDDAKSMALAEGALCFGISGSGPSCFAIFENENLEDIPQKVAQQFHHPARFWTHIF